MNLVRRAFYFTRRKWGKSLILFAVLLIIATFVLTGISILQAVDGASLSLRQSVGGSIKLELDETNGGNWQYQQGVGGTMVEYTGTPITDADIAKVLEVDGVSGYNAVGDGSVYGLDFDFIAGFTIGTSYTSSRLPSTTYSERFNFFARGAFVLTEGRHIVAEDSHVALISTALAEYNGLKLGDTITVQTSADYGHPENYAPVTLTIIGIYEYTGEEVQYASTSVLKANRIVIDHTAMMEIAGKGQIEYESGVDFYVDDPREIDRTAQAIRALDLDWSSFKLSVDNTAYLAVASSLEAMQSLVLTLVIVLCAVSAAILTIILTMWEKNRVHETGIYLSMGISKRSIVAQHILEVLLIAVFAFSLSAFTSKLIAQGTSDLIFNEVAADAEPYSMDVPDDGTELLDIDGRYIPFDAAETVSADIIEVHVAADSLVRVYALGVAIILLSVTVAQASTLRRNPKEIMTQMS